MGWTELISTKVNALGNRLPVAMNQNALDKGMVTISFDDFPQSARTEGAAALESFGWRGTFYMSGAYAGKKQLYSVDYFTDEDLFQLVSDGHEIGCHTFSHLRLNHSSVQQIEEDFDRNREYLQSIVPDYEMVSFAYPNGALSLGWKRRVMNHFQTARGVSPGLNGRQVEMSHLRAWPFYTGISRDVVCRALDEIGEGGWLHFFTHDVADSPTMYGCTPKELYFLLSEINARGLQCLPTSKAAELIKSGKGRIAA